MNQDFTVQKSNICLKKNSCRGVHLKKKFLHKQWAKKKFVQAENSPPPPPITFLMVRPLCKQAPKFTLFQMQWFFKPAWSKTHCYRAFPLDVTAAILVYQNNLIPRASPSKNGWLYPFFEGKALGTRLVPKQWSGSHVGVPNKSCGKLDYFY